MKPYIYLLSLCIAVVCLAAAHGDVVGASPRDKAIAEGRVSLEKGDGKAALARFDAALAAARDDAELIAWRGAAMAAVGGKAASRGDYFSALRISRRALGILDDAVRRAPSNASVYIIRAMTTREMPSMLGRSKQAREDFLKARSLLGPVGLAQMSPAERAGFLLALGDAHKSQKDMAAARDTWQEAAAVSGGGKDAETARQRLNGGK